MNSKIESLNNLDTEVVLLSTGKKVEVQKTKVKNEQEEDSVDDKETFERIRNVGSCSSAAGSNFFHSYRKIKQIEEERLNKMEEEYLEEKEKREFSMQRESRIMSYIESTSKKSEKRKKKKMQKVLKKPKNSNNKND
ncbi:unnamed protein product [Cryptosporidium hominis]|uniref:DUF1168 domain-containing protein n=1 Tax=Cryptosporidium hominis TaxID=237895 RepID=A0A0S4TH50_CRYHO|nr:hypothetical protein [Cryptosporidium hominis TU502]PPS96911.1 Uncharacterized protein GY17_00001610 [Cryptosporidium hominis]CUV06399.1 unnamed protein product [Cryptosporidium hominis]|eukprot:PPS96911.1 Uncharacterized protein GY17_00001610 [Cryptosporidium hominis]